jgi:hypothetical protein
MPVPTYESTKVYWAVTVASLAAPTVANITAGTDLTPWTPVAGVNVAAQQNKAALAMLGEAFVKEGIGTHTRSLTLTHTRDSVLADDDAFTLFTYKLQGHIIIARFGPAIAASRVEVYQVECGEPMPQPSAENELVTFTEEFAIQAFNQKATVAA